MNAKELREKSAQELTQLERQMRDELFKMRMRHYGDQLTQVHELRTKRRDIARVKTILAEKAKA